MAKPFTQYTDAELVAFIADKRQSDSERLDAVSEYFSRYPLHA